MSDELNNEQPQSPEEPFHQPEPPAAPTPQPGPPPPVPPVNRRDTDSLIVWGFVLSGLGLFCCCCGAPFSIAAIVLGAIASSRGDDRGKWVIIAGVVSLLGGGAFGSFGYQHRPPWVPDIQRNLPGGGRWT